jgi:hypothetical protein
MQTIDLRENPSEKEADHQHLARLVEENIKTNKEILIGLAEIKRYIRWQRIWATLRFVLILVPIILGIIYLPPFLRDFIDGYRQFFQ